MSSSIPLMQESFSDHEETSSRYDEERNATTNQHVRSQKWNSTPVILLSITTTIFALLWLRLFLQPKNTCSTIITGYDREWGPAKESISMRKTTYTSAFRYNASSKTYYREMDPAIGQYIGTPSQEIDRAWAELLTHQYLVLNEKEALEIDADAELINGVYIGEVEVMHSLHCLNAIRKELYPEYYATHDTHMIPEELRQLHTEHCFEQVRQNLQCAGDLTPLLLKPYGEIGHRFLIGTPGKHTCRDWNQFRTWYTVRGEQKGYISGRKSSELNGMRG